MKAHLHFGIRYRETKSGLEKKMQMIRNKKFKMKNRLQARQLFTYVI